MSFEIYRFNGIDGSTGSYLTPPLPPADVSALARGESVDPAHLAELRNRHQRDAEATFGPVEGVNPKDLASAGWGVLFAHDAPQGVKEALQPLLNYRTAQAAREQEHYYKEYAGPTGFRPTDSKRSFLARGGASAGMPADPDKVPYYLLRTTWPSFPCGRPITTPAATWCSATPPSVCRWGPGQTRPEFGVPWCRATRGS
jgi:hypothetical protein